ncbi:MAG: OmpA family protein [Myxococcales bacterium]|nr:OmpA family protein [Myxococcales bacterium]
MQITALTTLLILDAAVSASAAAPDVGASASAPDVSAEASAPDVSAEASAPEASAPAASASASGAGVAASAESGAAATDGASKRWILRERPRDHELEISVFGGVLAPARGIALRAEDAAPGEYRRPAADLGLRLGYYPSRFFGIEGELGLMPGRFNDQRALLYTARAQAVIQAGWWRILPFATLGGGVLGVRSDAVNAAGRATSPALHVGGGLKVNVTERLGVRVDVRDVIIPAADSGSRPTHSAEALVSVALRFGVAPKPPAAPPPPPDADGDGIADADDWCSHEAGEDEHGCPYRDGDCDGVKDNVDTCPAERGIEPDGCPPPDSDGDTIADPDDACPDAAGPAPSGCPDVDGDGIEVPDDRCPDAPETVNGYADSDGCPDELPAEVQRFSGVIDGIRFDSARATIRPESRPTLDDAVRVLVAYPELRLEISGHTDDRGRRERNVELSQARADAVRTYLIDHGVAGERIQTRGVGPDEPIADNASAVGRAQNRRIEFRVLR